MKKSYKKESGIKKEGQKTDNVSEAGSIYSLLIGLM